MRSQTRHGLTTNYHTQYETFMPQNNDKHLGSKLTRAERRKAERGQRADAPLAIQNHAQRVEDAAKPIPWLVHGLLPLGGIGALIAPPKTYKTMLAIELSKCVSLGESFAERACMQGQVLYVATDAPGSTIRRLAKLPDDAGKRIHSLRELLLPADAPRLQQLIEKRAEKYPQRPYVAYSCGSLRYYPLFSGSIRLKDPHVRAKGLARQFNNWCNAD